MAEAENKAVVRRFVEDVQSRGNLAGIYAFLPSNFVNHTPTAGFTPDRDGVRKLFAALHSGLPGLHVEIEDQIAEGDLVFTRKTLHGTHSGELFGVAATGKTVAVEIMDTLRVRDGQILEHWGIADTAGLMTQLGVLGG